MLPTAAVDELVKSDNIFNQLNQIQNPESFRSNAIRILGKTQHQFVLRRKAALSKRKVNRLKMLYTKNTEAVCAKKVKKTQPEIKKEIVKKHNQ